MSNVTDKATGKIIGNYQRMVEFIRDAVSHSCCSCQSDCCIACDAQKLLEEIGELNYEKNQTSVGCFIHHHCRNV